MPTYEYACKACGHEWEEIQKMSDPPLEVCEKCGKSTAQRLISQGNFILKGGGWYTTGGYGSKSTKSEPTKSEPTKPTDDGGGSGAKKPETKTTETKSSDSGGSGTSGTSGGTGSGGETKSAAA